MNAFSSFSLSLSFPRNRFHCLSCFPESFFIIIIFLVCVVATVVVAFLKLSFCVDGCFRRKRVHQDLVSTEKKLLDCSSRNNASGTENKPIESSLEYTATLGLQVRMNVFHTNACWQNVLEVRRPLKAKGKC